ncbi:hypothetical protein [Halorientalis halophila]|uniref:hypothetical protein n=1 Tax=Halorientalis halophila TaxID=3108499 RepID=UPI003009FE5C
MLTTSPVGLLTIALALLAAVAAGTIAHELAHAAVLRAAGVACEIRWLPAAGSGDSDRRGPWATVNPRVDAASPSPVVLRIAALAPLVLALPLAMALPGLGPNPFANGSLAMQAAAIGWLGCALPSPQDFSVVWYADRALARATASGGDSVDSA